MTRHEFIEWLESIGAIFEASDDMEIVDSVWVLSKADFNKKYTKNGRVRKGQKDRYIPYLRVGHFGIYDDKLYTRDNGLTGWLTLKEVKDICVELSK